MIFLGQAQGEGLAKLPLQGMDGSHNFRTQI